MYIWSRPLPNDVTRFRAIVVGISPRETESCFRDQGLSVRIREFSPLITIAVGLTKRKVLEMGELPVHPTRLWMPFVLGLWAVEAIWSFLAVASFFLRWPGALFWFLLAASLLWGVLSLLVSSNYLTRAARENDTSASPGPLGEIADLGGLYSGEGVLILIGILLAAALVWFVLFILWLPLVLLVLSGLTFGEAWRNYRCVWVVVEDTDSFRQTGKRLLDLGAVLSRSWDGHLDEDDRRRAAASRNAHYRANRTLAAVGLSSLGLVVALLSGKFLPEIGTMVVIAAAGLTGLASIFFADAVRRLRGLGHRD